jgi:hypothetical protein
VTTLSSTAVGSELSGVTMTETRPVEVLPWLVSSVYWNVSVPMNASFGV